MGQKVHPYGFSLGFNKTWRSRWYADRDYAKLLHEDLALKTDLKKRFSHAGVSKIEIERAANKLKLDIYTSRPGIIIGRKGTEVDKLKKAGGNATLGSIDDLPFADKSFDLLCAFDVIEHVPSPESYLKEIRNSLKSNGRLFLMTPNTNDLLFDLDKENFEPFYYRTAHSYYFCKDSIKFLMMQI